MGRGSGGKGRSAVEAATAAGLPVFCRPRHYVRSANVYVVPLWDLTSRWMPDELSKHAPAVASASSASSASRAASAVAKPAGNDTVAATGASVADEEEEDVAAEADIAAGERAKAEGDESGSDSEQSEVAWEGPLGSDARLWSRAEVEGALVLVRRLQSAPARERGAAARKPPNAASSDAQADGGGYPGGGGDGEEAFEASAATGSSALPLYGLGVSSALFPPEALAACTDDRLDRRLAEVLRNREPRWAVCALRSGHFAGAVFHGAEPVVHKAIHRYTVRAKAGGAQSTCDAGRKVKSAGSNLRRYGEQRLAEEIKELMTEKWAAELAACELIFVSVSKRMRPTLLGTEREPFLPNAQVRKMPFMVGKPTFEAIREAHLKVASVVFADEQTADTLAAKFRPAPQAEEAQEQQPPPAAPAQQKVTVAEEPPPQKYCEEDDELYTPLHAAAAEGNEDLIKQLLDDGADPTARDGKGRVPYYLCTGQRAREAFRRWRGANEDEWDWQAALVPEGLTEESDQRKKEKEKEKRDRKKAKAKEAKAKAKEEEEEKKRKEEEEAKALEAAQAKCDNCGKPLVSKPFSRLNFFYCAPECVNAHRRTLQAEAAMKRLA